MRPKRLHGEVMANAGDSIPALLEEDDRHEEEAYEIAERRRRRDMGKSDSE